MSKFKYLILIMAMVLLLPLCVFAEDEEESSNEEKSEAIVYFFRGEGCSHCAETEAWFKSIEDEYGSKFKIVDYETWNDEDNADLMKEVAKARGEEEQATGVPYIIIGDKSWVGFTDEYKEEIKEQIDKVYNQDKNERYDVIDLLGKSRKNEKKDSSSDVAALIIIILACGAIGFGIYKARKSSN